ncbi:MAG TPA: competence/damage-inducible protein A [Bacteroidota bacterium]|nr:competence/damage-inducible protein A [Bacteroidota bacterium]
MKSILVTIGDELLIGQVINTNAAFIARLLNSIGVDTVRHLTVGDRRGEILAALRESIPLHPVTIVTGGLGPTHDDITVATLCEYFKTTLRPDPSARRQVEKFLTARGLPWNEAAESQCLVPAGAEIIPNELGTASGLLLKEGKQICIVLPGVPYEMAAMMENSVIPMLREMSAGSVILHRTLRTTGIAESALAARLGPVGDFLGEATLAFLPSPGGVRLRITMKGSERAGAELEISRIERHIRERAGNFVYGIDEEEIEAAVGRLLAERGLTIAVAESCTGGLIGHKITRIPGSSAYFDRAVVAYSNRSKTEMLGVPAPLIASHGAVSAEAATAMAAGIRERSGTDIGLSTTGIAGPSGGTPEKPEGLVWIGYADSRRSYARRYTFGTGRERVNERAAVAGLDLVRRELLGIADDAAGR